MRPPRQAALVLMAAKQRKFPMENLYVDQRSFEYALTLINDGFIFEKFAQSFLSCVLGYDFIPAGKILDRGIDGLQHIYNRKGFESYIYQMSCTSSPIPKLTDSLNKLKDNGIEHNAFYYVTNRVVDDKDILIDKLYELHAKPIHIYDLTWFTSNANHSEGTIRTFRSFVTNYMHEFAQPGKTFQIENLIDDPRLFVFLRQQWELNKHNLDLHVILADTLILFVLEGTDPDKAIFRTEDEIFNLIAQYLKFDPKLLHSTILARLKTLSTKPRKIQYHSIGKAYCLPFESRLEIQDRNLSDSRLCVAFNEQSEKRIKHYLSDMKIQVKDCLSLVHSTFNRIFYQQGLEFSDFVLQGDNPDAFEKELAEVISEVVNNSQVIVKNREGVKSALLLSIRDIVYNGTEEQKLFLKKLSNTYMMLFLLQCDPKLCTFFNSLAAKMNIYVCTSIIIPALSEFYLPDINRRHWNLLTGAHSAGVKLIINETILHELISHFQMIQARYEEYYRDMEDVYLQDEMQLLYVDEVMIRAYYYSKLRGQVPDFQSYIDNFVTPHSTSIEGELIEWLNETFGIVYIPDSKNGISVDKTDEEALVSLLKEEKSHLAKAKNKAHLILTIYAIRDKNNENGESGIFGFKTWWLSKDTVTHKSLSKALGSKYDISCYIRPDFLYNYISLAPNREQIDSAFKAIFPNLLGVNISYHLPKDVVAAVHNLLSQHKDKNHARMRAILRNMIDSMKHDPTLQTKNWVTSYFETNIDRG